MTAAVLDEPIPDLQTDGGRPYVTGQAALQLAFGRSQEVVLSGPAGTGKSRMVLEYLHACAQEYPGMRALIVRRTRESLTESALVTFEDKVLPAGSPMLSGAGRRLRQSYPYPNGSSIVVGGLDKPQKVLSTEYDLIYVQQAEEVTEHEWELLITRLRNGKMPFQRCLGDANPDRPDHWIRRRWEKRKLELIVTRHEDNPLMWDGERWTEYGEAYLEKLRALTGMRRRRLLDGEWCQAEGLVWEGWNPDVHLIDRFEIPADWRRIVSVDFGFSHPFVAQWWAEDGDGRLYRYREIYRTRRIVEDHAAMMLGFMAQEPKLAAIVCDHDSGDRATLERHIGIGTTLANKAVKTGCDAVAERLKVLADGRPRLFLLRDSLVELDRDRDAMKLPTSTEGEIAGYVMNEQRDAPVKENDDGCDAMRYAAMYFGIPSAVAPVQRSTMAALAPSREQRRDARVARQMARRMGR